MEENIHADKVEMRHFEIAFKTSNPQTPLWLLNIYYKFNGTQR